MVNWDTIPGATGRRSSGWGVTFDEPGELVGSLLDEPVPVRPFDCRVEGGAPLGQDGFTTGFDVRSARMGDVDAVLELWRTAAENESRPADTHASVVGLLWACRGWRRCCPARRPRTPSAGLPTRAAPGPAGRRARGYGVAAVGAVLRADRPEQVLAGLLHALGESG